VGSFHTLIHFFILMDSLGFVIHFSSMGSLYFLIHFRTLGSFLGVIHPHLTRLFWWGHPFCVYAYLPHTVFPLIRKLKVIASAGIKMAVEASGCFVEPIPYDVLQDTSSLHLDRLFQKKHCCSRTCKSQNDISPSNSLSFEFI